jgi:ferredoxin, 2Fe-2S
MVKVTFIAHDGQETTLKGAIGDSVMSLAIAEGLDGIVAECGGSMMCATCHCYVDDDWTQKVGARMDGEDDMLESAACEVRDTSRLSCQIRLSESLDGLVVRLPEEQL